MLKGCLAVEVDGRLVKMSYAKPKDSMNLVFGGKQADETLTMHARDVAQKAIAGNAMRLCVAAASLHVFFVHFLMCNRPRTKKYLMCGQIAWAVWAQIWLL